MGPSHFSPPTKQAAAMSNSSVDVLNPPSSGSCNQSISGTRSRDKRRADRRRRAERKWQQLNWQVAVVAAAAADVIGSRPIDQFKWA